MKTVKTYKTTDLQNPDKVIDRMEGSWQAAYRNTQVALVATLHACYRDGDRPTAVARANRIVNAVSVAGNGKAIVEWLTTFGFSVGETDDGEVGFVDAPSRGELEEILEGSFKKAQDLMWWKLKPVNPFKGFTLSAKLNAVLAEAYKMDKLLAEGGEDAEKIDIDPEMLAGLETLLGKREVEEA